MGDAEPAPENGKPLGKGHVLIVLDTQVPAVASFTATPGVRTEAGLPLALAWSVQDANPLENSVAIELSRDQGQTWQPLRDSAPLTGSDQQSIAIGAETRLQLRLRARDLAKNDVTSAPLDVVVPPPPDLAVALARSIDALPPPDRLAHTEPPVEAKPPTEEARPPVAERGAVAQPDVIAPHALPETAALQPQEVAGGPVEDAYTSALIAERDGTAPAAALAPVTEPPPALVPSADAPWLSGAEAERALADARSVRSTDPAAAVPMLLRLHRSSVASEAIALHLDTLQGLGRQRELIGVVANLAPEYHDDNARIEAAIALIAIRDFDAAVQELAPIRSGSPQARQGTFRLAEALAGLGRTAEAGRLFQVVAQGDDEWAQAARGRIGGK